MRGKYQYTILSVVILLAGWYALRHPKFLEPLREVSPVAIVLLALLSVGTHIANSCRFRTLMNSFSIRLSHKEAFGISVCNTMFNYYLPARGGLLVRAYYLKIRHRFSYSNYISMTLVSQALASFVSALLGLLLMLLYWALYGVLHQGLLAIFSVLVLLVFLAAVVYAWSVRFGNKIKNDRIRTTFRSLHAGIASVRRDSRTLGSFVAFYMLAILVIGIRLLVAFAAIGLGVRPLQVLIIPCLTTFSMLLPLTPANIGINEGIISGTAYLFGIPADQALVAALLDRAVTVVVTFVLGLILGRLLMADMTTREKEPSRR